MSLTVPHPLPVATPASLAPASPVATPASPVEEVAADTTLIILPWPDPVVDPVGYDPRSPYVEQFWLGVLGPTTVWLLRRLASGFDAYPDGFEIDVIETAAALGLAATASRNGPFARTVSRCVQFGMAHESGWGLAVRRRLPPLSHRQCMKLPTVVQEAHRAWLSADTMEHRASEQRARAEIIARTLLELGDDPDQTTRHLLALGLSADVCDEAMAAARRPDRPLPLDAA